MEEGEERVRKAEREMDKLHLMKEHSLRTHECGVWE